jgi:hypothetical protein
MALLVINSIYLISSFLDTYCNYFNLKDKDLFITNLIINKLKSSKDKIFCKRDYSTDLKNNLDFKNNKEYNELLNLSRYILHMQLKNLIGLNYNEYFDSNLALHIKIIYSDIVLYKDKYGEDVDKFISF